MTPQKGLFARRNLFQVQKHPSHSTKMQEIAVIRNIPYFLPVVYQYIRKWYYIWQYIYKNTIKSNENRSPLCQTYRLIFVENFTDSQDRHTGVFDWLIHGAKHHKENQLQSLELLCGML